MGRYTAVDTDDDISFFGLIPPLSFSSLIALRFAETLILKVPEALARRLASFEFIFTLSCKTLFRHSSIRPTRITSKARLSTFPGSGTSLESARRHSDSSTARRMEGREDLLRSTFAKVVGTEMSDVLAGRGRKKTGCRVPPSLPTFDNFDIDLILRSRETRPDVEVSKL